MHPHRFGPVGATLETASCYYASILINASAPLPIRKYAGTHNEKHAYIVCDTRNQRNLFSVSKVPQMITLDNELAYNLLSKVD